MQYLKKINVRSIGISIEDTETVAEREQSPTTIMRVYGTCRGATQKTSDIGPYSVFNGEFEAINCVTGEKYRSSTLILPEVGELVLNNQLGASEDDDNISGIQFAIDLTVEPNKSSKGGRSYKFGVKPLIESDDTDPLLSMGRMLEEKIPVQITG